MNIYKWIECIFEKFLKNNLHRCDGCEQSIDKGILCYDCTVERKFII
jgi:hypothetical protein